jgi:hypothetical protein
MARDPKQNRGEISDKIIFDLPTTIGVEFSAALRTVLVKATTASWEFWYGLLREFREREGHCQVPAEHKEDGFRLGYWVSNQRNGNNKLSHEKIQRLDAIGFVWNTNSAAWSEGYSKLAAFKAREGHLRVPVKHKEDNFRLGSWVNAQRNSRHSLNAERFKQLESIGFVWEPLEDRWVQSFNYLEAFKAREGHCRVPVTHKEESHKLGQWVSVQRTSKDLLSAARRQRLEDIGFVWDPLAEAWEDAFSELQTFKAREGHCLVPQKHVESGFRLGSWVGNQRVNRAKLSPERLEKLNAIGFVWSTK